MNAPIDHHKQYQPTPVSEVTGDPPEVRQIRAQTAEVLREIAEAAQAGDPYRTSALAAGLNVLLDRLHWALHLPKVPAA
jgi:hypothetical protein